MTNIAIDAENFVAEVTTNPRNILDRDDTPIVRRDVHFVAKDILAVTHAKTNGVHCGAIFDRPEKKIFIFREDIGRHNVFDKLHGWSIRLRANSQFKGTRD